MKNEPRVVSLSARGGVRYHSVSGTARHERVRGRPAVGPRHDGDGSGSARQGKIGGSSFVAVMGRLKKKGEWARGERKEDCPALNE
jgi:hypothetical protein